MFATRACLVAGLLVPVGAEIAGRAEPPAPSPSSHEERVRVRRVRLPVYLTAQKPGGCEGVDASAVEIREDGMPLEALHLDAGRLAAEHVLLLDTSESMAARLQPTKQAAIAYAKSLPADEPAMLASFDDDLLLHCPMTTDRARFEQRVGEMSIGFRTHLWDSLVQMVGYLRSRDRRTVLILLSDGCDTEPGSATRADDAIEAAASVTALTVYPIGLELPARCPDDAADPREALTRLARATGGRYFDIDSPARVPFVLRRIRAALDDERYVSYEPPAFGEAPKDRSARGRENRRWRRVQVGLRGRSPCKIRLGSGYRRLQTATGPPIAAPDAARFRYEPQTGLLHGTLDDVLRDNGPLARRGIIGSANVLWVDERERAERYVATSVPPLERVAWSGALPEYGLFHALMQLTPEAADLGLPQIEGGLTHWTAAPFLVNGRTLLRHRVELGRALAQRPDYREWATERLRRRRLDEVDRAALELGPAVNDPALHAIRELIAGPEWRPGDDELAPYLCEWLGDVPALRLHRAAEAWLIERLLIGTRHSGSETAPREWIEQSEGLWRDLGFLFTEHRAVRVFGLLVPGYDPALDRLGFYRIVLPRPTTLVNVWHSSPDAPRGLRLMSWALAQPGFREVFSETPLVVRGVRYGLVAASAAELLELVELPVPADEPPSHLLRVRVELAYRSPLEERVELRAVFAYRAFGGVDPGRPLCIETSRDVAGGIRSRRLVQALVDAQAQAPVPCLVDSEVLDTWGSRR
jgi:hypothetical protein